MVPGLARRASLTRDCIAVALPDSADCASSRSEPPALWWWEDSPPAQGWWLAPLAQPLRSLVGDRSRAPAEARRGRGCAARGGGRLRRPRIRPTNRRDV